MLEGRILVSVIMLIAFAAAVVLLLPMHQKRAFSLW
jgi:hypothetical protein